MGVKQKVAGLPLSYREQEFAVYLLKFFFFRRIFGVSSLYMFDCLFMYIYLFCCSVAKLCLTVCDSMDCSTPGFPVLPYHLEFAQIHVR